jgi:HlyD family type I secretion membrane fusion protein
MTTMTATLPAGAPVLRPETRVASVLTGGFLVLAVGLGGMTAWGALAPLHSAVVAAGSLVPETGSKTVKHSEGGTVAEVLVHEGDTVKAGQTLIRLDSTEAATRLEMLNSAWLDSLGLEARLTAELFDQPAIVWPDELTARRKAGSPAVARLMDNERKLFEVRRAEIEVEAKVIGERVVTLAAEAASLGQQRRFISRELALTLEHLQLNRDLLARGNGTRSRVVELEIEETRIKGRDQEIDARINQAHQTAAEAKSDLVRRRHDFREKVLTELEKTRGEASRMVEQIRDAANRLSTRDIKAPDEGTVVMHGHLATGVTVSPSEPILDIVPDHRALLAEVHVQPKDIKSLTVGHPVKVTLAAYDSRVVGALDGSVDYISADRMSDPATRQDYFLVRIRLKDGTAHSVNNLTIKAGMPVEARILLDGRTPMAYLLQPLSQSYLKAFIQE